MRFIKLTLWTTVLLYISTSAQSLSLANFEDEIQQIVKKTRASVVSIKSCLGNKRHVNYSGVVLDQQGHIITVVSAVKNASRICVRLVSGEKYNAHLVGTDPKTNLAVIKIGEAVELSPVAKRASEDELQVGAFLLSIGNPYGLSQSASLGIVSGKNRSVRQNDAILTGLIQTTVTMNPGDSGGLVVDSQGKFVGMMLSSLRSNSTDFPQGINFVLPSETIYWVKDNIVAHGKVPRGWMGIQVEDRTDSKGVTITKVEKDSPADKYGLKKGDCLLYLNDAPIKDSLSLLHRISHTVQGQWVKLHLLGGKKDEKTVSVCLEKSK